MTAPARARVPLANPFPGLRPFQPGEEHIFFGRENQVHTMIDKLARARLLAVIGSSGSGKSSLVNCGLRPSLHQGTMSGAGSTWRVAQFRPGGNPIRELARALASDGLSFDHLEDLDVPLDQLLEATLRMSKLGLVDAYAQAFPQGGPNLLVVADQFEELFRYRQTRIRAPNQSTDAAQEAVAFVNLLLEARMQRDFPIYVVLTMRSDFLGDCAEIPGLAEAINEGQYLVPRLTREERRMAIIGPAAVYDGAVSPILVTQLVNDVGDNPDQLSVLQHALNRTWMRWQHQDQDAVDMTLDQYNAIGTMSHALDYHADKAYSELTTDRERDICRMMFRALTDVASDGRGVRRPTTLGTLCALCDAAEHELVRVIDVFRKPSRSFLMPPIRETLHADSVIDISHESLMRVWNRLKAWAEEEAQSEKLYSRLLESASLYEQGRAALAQDPELQLALNWRAHAKPTAVWADRYGGGFESVMRYLDSSETLRQRQRREAEERQKREIFRTRLLWGSIATTMFVLAVAGVIFFREREKDALNAARDRAREARLAQLAKEQAEQLQSILFLQTRLETAEKSAKEAKSSAEKNRIDSERRQLKQELESARNYLQVLNQKQSKTEPEQPARIRQTKLPPNAFGRPAGLFHKDRGTVIKRSSGANNPYNMFGDRRPAPPEDIATFFADHLPIGFNHWVEWMMPANVLVASVQIFARHDPPEPGKKIEFQRAFTRFRFKAQSNGQWVDLIDYEPPLPYGQTINVTDAADAPIPESKTEGVSLALCFDIPPINAQDFRAEFVQAKDWYGYSGPRVDKLDARSTPCRALR